MKITMESTEEFVSLDGVVARLWKGTTAAGVEVVVAVHRVLVPRQADHAAFEAELRSETEPTEAAVVLVIPVDLQKPPTPTPGEKPS